MSNAGEFDELESVRHVTATLVAPLITLRWSGFVIEPAGLGHLVARSAGV